MEASEVRYEELGTSESESYRDVENVHQPAGLFVEEGLETEESGELSLGGGIPKRYLFAGLVLFGLSQVFILRFTYLLLSPLLMQRFNWTNIEQGFSFSAFYIGYLLTQLPSSHLCSVYGGYKVFSLSILITAIITLFAPFFVKICITLSPSLVIWGFCLVRVAQGLGEGLVMPAVIVLLRNWSPKTERSRLLAICLAGPPLGILVSSPLVGALLGREGTKSQLVNLDLLGNWAILYYVPALLILLWYVLFRVFASDGPETHRTISNAEREYIITTREASQQVSEDPENVVSTKDARPDSDSTPKLAQVFSFTSNLNTILRHSAVWAVLINSFCVTWVYGSFQWFPTFTTTAIGIPIGGLVGLIMTVPILLGVTLSGSVAAITDYCIKNGARPIKVRRITLGCAQGSAGLMLFAGCAIAMTYKIPGLVVMILALSCSSPVMTQIYTNLYEVAGKRAGEVNGVMNMLNSCAEIIAPMYAGVAVGENKSDFNGWLIVFGTCCAMYYTGYLLWAWLAKDQPVVKV